MEKFVAIEVAFEVIEALREPVKAIRRGNKDLADQLLRAAVSVASNIEEGRGRDKGDRRHLWSVAYGSAREMKIQLRSAVALGLVVQETGEELVEKADRLVGLCYGLAHSRK
jgi:four helix bundle protein